MPKVKQWISFFSNKEDVQKCLRRIYGEDYAHTLDKQEQILKVLKFHLEEYGNEDVIIVRAPGRINLMGRHIDHQGGRVNLIAIDREIFLVSSLRKDTKIKAQNVEHGSFSSFEFDLSPFEIEYTNQWTYFLNFEELPKKIRSSKGEWSDYFKAAQLRLNFLRGNCAKGANFSVIGNIPIAAGLSSSSALTVGVLKTLAILNHIHLSDIKVIEYCAEAEFFIGTRGGASDHVAIVKSEKNEISHVKLLDLEILTRVEFPHNIDLIVVNTNILAKKSSEKRDLFNEKVLAYEIGFNLIKLKFSQYKSTIKYLRDINLDNLTLKEILEILLELPEYVEFKDIAKMLGDIWKDIRNKYHFHKPILNIPLRKVIAYGISECERSKLFFKYIKEGNCLSAGNLMNISHDADRKYRFSSDFTKIPHNNELPDKIIKRFVKENDFQTNSIKLAEISGGYDCSIPEIDFIVDLVKKEDGVLGAQISGAGLGGCVMILVEKPFSPAIKSLIQDEYVKMFNKECSIYLCKPVEGCSIFQDIKI